MDEFRTMYKRLKGHYDNLLEEYDQVHLEDLAHSLRLWADSRDDVDKIFGRDFNGFSFGTKLKKFLWSKQYLIVVLSSGLGTRAGFLTEDGQFSLVRGKFLANGPFTHFMEIKPVDNYKLVLFKRFAVIEGPSEGGGHLIDNSIMKDRMTFKNWLGADALRYCVMDGDKLVRPQITREALIRRVANLDGGSHPKTTNPETSLDKHIFQLLEEKVSQLPLPYFVLMDFARQIIENYEQNAA